MDNIILNLIPLTEIKKKVKFYSLLNLFFFKKKMEVLEICNLIQKDL